MSTRSEAEGAPPDRYELPGGYSAVRRGSWSWTVCRDGAPLRLPCGDEVTIDGDGEELRAFLAAIATAPLALPVEMTPDIELVFGMPNFVAGPYASLFRAAGAEIRPKAEAEQAFILWWLLRLVLQHGAAWKDRADEQLTAARDAVRAKQPGEAAP